MSVGAFSLSLPVKDLKESTTFYAKLGFEPFAGDGESWSILYDGATVIGVFQGAIEKTALTFNPGWAGPGVPAEEFEDVRALRTRLAADGIEVLEDTTEDSAEGPASFKIQDPDGNEILFDQHV
jgi:catechol 2,3-dioxygenase-like lactoylglutathione lyase family enzyme